ncbi:hypothetical protein BHE74_00055037 [Ensete ventricosum]|nr:hypothetical protein GW17_00044919 [Ensete ventricosum]RWW39619.1 hypothetical protein BHE74_00055037 [Ensete ventricosum]
MPLTPLSPSAPPSLPLHRRRLPLPTRSRPAKGWPPLRLAPPPFLAARLAAGGNPFRAPYSRPPCCYHCGRQPPLAGVVGFPFELALAAASRPLAGGLSRDLAVGGRPCMGAGRGWPLLLLAAFAMKT